MSWHDVDVRVAHRDERLVEIRVAPDLTGRAKQRPVWSALETTFDDVRSHDACDEKGPFRCGKRPFVFGRRPSLRIGRGGGCRSTRSRSRCLAPPRNVHEYREKNRGKQNQANKSYACSRHCLVIRKLWPEVVRTVRIGTPFTERKHKYAENLSLLVAKDSQFRECMCTKARATPRRSACATSYPTRGAA